MTPETLKKAQILGDELDHLKDEIQRWKEAYCFDETEPIYLKSKYGNGVVVDSSLVPFEVIRTRTLAELEEKIKPLQAEFDTL